MTAPRGLTSIVRQIRRPFDEFVRAETSGGVVLFVAALVAIVWANSPWAPAYHHLWEQHFAVGVRPWILNLSLHAWINDALMAVFFLVVGLEIKREFLTGELASARSAALPIVGALGGMIVPALVFAVITRGTPGAAGWAIPMATDIAFALGVVTLLGSRVPLGLKVFLAALAIVDDLGAVLVIALFYTTEISVVALAACAVAMTCLIALNRLNVNKAWPYVLLGTLLWLAVLKSGLHATIAGVLLALAIPSTAPDGESRIASPAGVSPDGAESGVDASAPSLLYRFEHSLHGVVAFGIMPLFALANAGVNLSGNTGAVLGDPLVLAVVLGLVVGKPLGIVGFSYGAVRLNIAQLPESASWRQLGGVAVLAGIGFTMSLFIGALAFGTSPQLTAAKIGVLGGSLLAGIIGWSVLRGAKNSASG